MRRFDEKMRRAEIEHREHGTTVKLGLVLHLRTITPVLGGGAKPWQPSDIEPLRVPAIRGHLRWWWRALCRANLRPNQMFAEETALWGGVTEREAIRSRVTFRATDMKFDAIAPAGRHRYEERPDRSGQLRPKLKTPPHWEIGNGLGYALFPLQCSDEERGKWLKMHLKEDMPTRNVLRGLQFTLDIRVFDATQESLEHFIHAVWLWISLGGIGARTRRGFGALFLTKPPTLTGGNEITAKARELFEVKEVNAFLDRVRSLLNAEVRRPIDHIDAGPKQNSYDRAHAYLVSALQQFRQAEGTGRARRTRDGGRPGSSHWPEPQTLRVKRNAGRYDNGHAPDAKTQAAVSQGKQGIPRAAFGLPLEVKFLEDREHEFDKQANAGVYPYEARISVGNGERISRQSSDDDPLRRFASPLLLRPVVVGGSVFPFVIVLGGEWVESVRLDWRNYHDPKPVGVAVRKGKGARDEIDTYLRATNGDAVVAFRNWYVAKEPNPGDRRHHKSHGHRGGGRKTQGRRP